MNANPTVLDNILFFENNVNLKNRKKRKIYNDSSPIHHLSNSSNNNNNNNNNNDNLNIHQLKRSKSLNVIDDYDEEVERRGINSLKMALKAQYNISIEDYAKKSQNQINDNNNNNNEMVNIGSLEYKLAEWIIQFIHKTILWIHIQNTVGTQETIHNLISSALENSIDDIPEVIPNLKDTCKLYISRSRELLELSDKSTVKTNRFAEEFVEGLVKDVMRRRSVL